MMSPDAGVEVTRKPESPPVGDSDFVLEIGQATDPGVVRRENEDALAFECPLDPVLRRERGALFVVATGSEGWLQAIMPASGPSAFSSVSTMPPQKALVTGCSGTLRSGPIET
jgi:hypothetical protein